MEIKIEIPDTPDRVSWVIPFNDVSPDKGDTASAFLYIRNTGESNVILDCLTIASTGRVSVVQIHSVLGEAEFVREMEIKPVNKNTWRNGFLPDLEVKQAENIHEIYSNGQLDRLDMKEENTTYKTKPSIVIAPQSIVVLTATTVGTLSGIVTVSQEVDLEED